jgi:uncharacterized protein (TIGR01777 family)
LHFVRQTDLPLPVERVFAWHERPGAFERLSPPWQSAKVIDRKGTIRDGDLTTIRVRLAGLPIDWVAEHYGFAEPRQFCDRQLAGPFAAWEHRHAFDTAGGDRSLLTDDITFTLRGGRLGRLLGQRQIEHMLDRLFQYRHKIMNDDMIALATYPASRVMNIGITGASGLVGSALAPLLTTGGHSVVRLSRRGTSSNKAGNATSASWDPSTGDIDEAQQFDAIVHLAGENIAGGRWNAKRKQAIRDSRVGPTRRLCEALARRSNKPSTLICASAIGFYGSRGDEPLTEDSLPGEGFLAEVCKEWEAATAPAIEAGIRVVNLRIGVILTPQGGALSSMLTPFKLGGGGVIGSGRQFWSWVAIDDVIGAIQHALATESLHGPVNCTAPEPVTNAEFTKTLGRVLRRPTVVPMPAFAARLLLGEMADALLLSSARVLPRRLEASGYRFRCPALEGALRHVLGK